MSPDLGRPPMAAYNQDLVAKRLQEGARTGGVRESVKIEWRGQPVNVEVIDMPTDTLYYNPGTHRIRAQRSHDPRLDTALDANPWSAESQAYLHHLLQAKPSNPHETDPDFAELKKSILDFGQNDPGLITRDGILVNGNSRRAALKELGKQSIRVGVLPGDCTWEDISAVELSLQLRKDHRREYSYINRLLAIEEQVGLGRPIGSVAHDFRSNAAACEQDLWVLTCIREMIDRSSSGDVSLRLIDFEEHQEKLKELRRRYAKEVADNKRDSAEMIKEARTAAMMLGFSKTDVRVIDEDFLDRYLSKQLPEEFHTPAAKTPAAVVIPGLNRTVQPAESPRVAAAKAFTDTVLRTKAAAGAADKLSPADVKAASEKFEAVREAVERALDPAGRDARLRKRKRAAPDRLNDASQDIDQCITDLVLSRANRSLDEEAFDEGVLQLRDSLSKLAKEAQRSITEPGDGVMWLLAAVQQENK
ncbi:ParB N-terminal domain-containing protein [Kitasatospora sp. NPDC051170]|uniref:ParB N-terminal domain-containing protein n=1 Tax=Kitasatospora sp. NPDC051170 TaxID=3364056 RepID=UPI0037BD3036